MAEQAVNLPELLRLARAGDPAARETLFQQMRWFLEGAVRHLPSLPWQAGNDSDSIQDVLVVVIREFDRFRGNTGSELRGWLRSILRSCRLNKVRRLQTAKRDIDREQPLDGAPELAAPRTDSSTKVSENRRRQIERIVRALPPHYRMVLWLRSRGLTFDSIGCQLGRSADAAHKLWRRAFLELSRRRDETGGVIATENLGIGNRA